MWFFLKSYASNGWIYGTIYNDAAYFIGNNDCEIFTRCYSTIFGICVDGYWEGFSDVLFEKYYNSIVFLNGYSSSMECSLNCSSIDQNTFWNDS